MATTNNETVGDRILSMEETLAHQASAIEELSEMLTKQWNVIDRLERKIETMTGRMTALEENIPPPESTPPPHW